MKSRTILLGLALGAVTGLFFGERVGVLEIVADGYVKLLQMTVLPFVLVSLVTGIGSLTLDQVRTLGVRAGLVLGLLWIIGLTLAFVFPLMFPPTVTASFFSTTLLDPPPVFNFVDLYIPANPFRSLADNVVPAVVLFSIVLGIALISVPGRERLLETMGAARQALSTAAAYVSRLTPFGLFAIAAVAVGTLTFDQISRLQVYLLSYVALSVLISFWVLPALIPVLTPVPYRAVLAATHDSLITAFATSSLFIVLPALVDATQALAKQYGLDDAKAQASGVIVPASFNFPHVGKVLTISFVLFAGWLADAPVPIHSYPELALTGLLTLFGSVNAAVPYLLDLFRIPADTFQLFIATSVVNSRFGTLMAAVHTVTIALIGTWMVAGPLHIDTRRLVRYLVVTAVLTVGTVASVRAAASWLVPPDFQGGKILSRMGMLEEYGRATISDARSVTPDAVTSGTALDRVQARKALRVGFFADSLPFTYINDAGDLVGLDAEMAHRLARELDVTLEFVQLQRRELVNAFRSGVCDLVMSGVALTPERAAKLIFSESYLDETMAFIVPDHRRSEFSTWEQVRQAPLRLGVPNVPHYIEALHRDAPQAEIVVFDTVSAMFEKHEAVDALVLTAERGSSWTLLHPEYSVIVPTPDPVKVPLAYPVADASIAHVVNVWIETTRKDGTVKALYDHWILGRTATSVRPRWSIIRNVLHWVE
jgi:Na+/H+-dicarboxylate symporter/ABC-type amino acid transport substrate-binding protein